eukprot:4598232-Prymnesium_polylepis.1
MDAASAPSGSPSVGKAWRLPLHVLSGLAVSDRAARSFIRLGAPPLASSFLVVKPFGWHPSASVDEMMTHTLARESWRGQGRVEVRHTNLPSTVEYQT